MNVVDDSTVYIPIPHYPPFKLRSSLIDKDPVIWAHLIESYIALCKYLLDDNAKKLSIKSQQQLQLFLKIYLHETSEEENKIFSLGAINPDIVANGKTLRAYVYMLIKNHSIVKMNMNGASIWEFVTIYVRGNSVGVRNLVDGTFKSKFNDNKKSGNISSIDPVQKHLEMLISNGKLSKSDLTTLSTLLGHQSRSTNAITIRLPKNQRQVRNVNTNHTNSSQFADKFVVAKWIEMLEKLYLGGKGVNSQAAKDVMVISLLALPISKTAKVAMELGINNYTALKVYPLFGGIITSATYKELMPDLETRLPFLRKGSSSKQEPKIDDSQIQILLDFFPQLDKSKAITILKQNDLNVEKVTNMLLESPELIDLIPEEPEQASSSSVITKRSVYDNDKFSKLQFEPESVIYGKKSKQNMKEAEQDVKKKTLTAALRLIYESDEDEPDDTYDDQEKTSGSAQADRTGKLSLIVDDGELEDDSRGETTSNRSSGDNSLNRVETYLFSLFKKTPEALSREARKAPLRKTIRQETKWSDEQIEGWARMLEKNPKRFKILEEKFFFQSGGNTNAVGGKNKSSYRKEKIEDEDEDELDKEEAKPIAKRNTHKQPNPDASKTTSEKTTEKRQNARNEKNKSSRANHNRKAGHDKKLAKGF